MTSSEPRDKQLEYSTLQPAMHDEAGRRAKADKIRAVVSHFLGREDWTGLVVLDLGSSTGYVADHLRRTGARVLGVDIDEPGLTAARHRFPDGIGWLLADGSSLPLADGCIDVVVFNQIYEHVVDPDAVVAEIRRVLRPDGVAYLGLGNRLTLWEPHVRLPFASWLPAGLADRYVRAARRGSGYYERFRGRSALRRMLAGFVVWDYTWTVIAEPERFRAEDMVRGPIAAVPVRALRLLKGVVPTYIWLATGTAHPRGDTCQHPPTRE